MISSLLEKRLIVVTGKGGTGKTTVAAALGRAAAQNGQRALVAEMGFGEQLPGLFGRKEPAGYAGCEIEPGLQLMRIDPYEALAEYLGLQIGVRGLVRRVLANPAFHQFLDASPGWRELITLGKVWHLEQMRDENGAPRFDLIVIDAPATGHGLPFLEVPGVVLSAVRSGPLHRHAGWVEEMIRDSSRTLLLPVALAEELSARETSQLVQRVKDHGTIAVDRVVVNAVTQLPFPEELRDLDRHLDAIPADTALEGLPNAPVLAACARHLRSRYELNRRYVAEIAEVTHYPTVVVPYLPGGIQSPAALDRVADALCPRESAAAA